MMRVFDRLPVLQTAGISSVVNGPITYSGDGAPLVGRLPGRRNAYCMLGLRAGVGEGGGLGKVLAEIIVDGQSEWDTWVLDPRRFTQYADEAYASKKAVEEYQREFVFDHPDEHRPAGRRAKTTPLTEVLAAKGAEFGAINGWERTLYFHPAENDFEHIPAFRFSTHHDQVGREVQAVRSNVGVAEISGFTRFLVQGADAISWFDRLTAGRIPAVGRTSLAYVSDDQGRFLSRVHDDAALRGQLLAAQRGGGRVARPRRAHRRQPTRQRHDHEPHPRSQRTHDRRSELPRGAVGDHRRSARQQIVPVARRLERSRSLVSRWLRFASASPATWAGSCTCRWKRRVPVYEAIHAAGAGTGNRRLRAVGDRIDAHREELSGVEERPAYRVHRARGRPRPVREHGQGVPGARRHRSPTRRRDTDG